MTQDLVNESNLQNYLNFALELTVVSRGIIAEKTALGFDTALKSDNSFVTEVDTAVELALREKINKRFPEHGIFGEELPTLNPEASVRWILDPIDGTLSFKHGVPLFGTLISVELGGSPYVGVIDLPGIDRTLFAGKGQGTVARGLGCRNTPIKIQDLGSESDIVNLQEIIARCDRANFLRSGLSEKLDALEKLHSRVRAYSDCFGHALAVIGAVGAMIDFNICWWDITATKLLIEEAGGQFEVVEYLPSEGKPTRYSIVAGKPTVVRWIIKTLELRTVPSEIYIGSSSQIIGPRQHG